MRRILKPVTYILAALYFLVDAAFMAIAKPISDWLAGHVVLRRLRAWIRSLRPYPSLALRPGRAPVQPYPGQVDENSRLCLGVHKIPRSQDMAEKYRGLAIHSRNKQGCPSVSNRDEEIRSSGVSAVLKDCGGNPRKV